MQCNARSAVNAKELNNDFPDLKIKTGIEIKFNVQVGRIYN